MNSFQETDSDFGHFPHLYVEIFLALTQHVNTHEYTIFRLDNSWDISYEYLALRERVRIDNEERQKLPSLDANSPYQCDQFRNHILIYWKVIYDQKCKNKIENTPSINVARAKAYGNNRGWGGGGTSFLLEYFLQPQASQILLIGGRGGAVASRRFASGFYSLGYALFINE